MTHEEGIPYVCMLTACFRCRLGLVVTPRHWCIIMLIAVSWIRTDSLLGSIVICAPAK